MREPDDPVNPSPDDWAFGDGGFAKLYGDRLVQSSLMDEAVPTRWVFLFMCARADAKGRFHAATVAGLARAANVTLAQAQRAVDRLEAPDPASTTPEHEGRRIKRIPGGWLVLNLEKFRKYQTARQRAEAERKRAQREAAEKRRAEREADLARRERQLGHVPGRPGDVSATTAPDVRRQTSDATLTETDCGADAPPPRRPPSSSAKRGGTDAQKGNGVPSWNREACSLWCGAFGGTAPGGRIGKALKPLVAAHGWSDVERAWRSYLDQSDAEYASPQRFAATYGRWSGLVPAKTAKRGESVTEKNKRVLDQWERDVREGRR